MLDRNEREQARFALIDLPKHVERFGFILGVRRGAFRDQDPVNLETSELVARLHDALRASSYGGHDLELFLVQTVFCLLADDTGIFEPRDIFLHFLKERTAADNSDVGLWLTRLFQVLNTPPDRHQQAPGEDLTRSPHVNGELFAETGALSSDEPRLAQARQRSPSTIGHMRRIGITSPDLRTPRGSPSKRSSEPMSSQFGDVGSKDFTGTGTSARETLLAWRWALV